jgi:predicted nucleic acid-binding protein
MKKNIYLDTTIPSYLFDSREQIKFLTSLTRKWWDEESGKFDITTSESMINELSRGNYPEKEKIMEFAIAIPLLPFDENILEIAKIYISNYLMPRDLEGDAMHLAYASYYKIDFLLTWNCNHLANSNKKKHIRFINTNLGLFIPEITTPMELFEVKEDN